MALVRAGDTKPEIRVRKALHAAGLRFRLHRADLPGKPDVYLPRLKTVVLVHGCFWHRHEGCPRCRMPKTRQEFWKPKFERNVKRDREVRAALQAMGLRVETIWECETEKAALVAKFVCRIASSGESDPKDFASAILAAVPIPSR